MDVPVFMGIALTTSVIICGVGIVFTLIMLIVLLVTLSNGKAKERKMIESAANSNSVRAARRNATTGNRITSQPVVRNVPRQQPNAPQTNAPKPQAAVKPTPVNTAAKPAEDKTSTMSTNATAEMTATMSTDATAEMTATMSTDATAEMQTEKL
jgi:Na+-transporting methylmalonyl-CoA/oxaloacetate decarboxylase gamma subunit